MADIFDPNENLREQLELAGMLQDEALEGDAIRMGGKLAELVQAMNEWLSGGGALPAAWEHPRGPGDYPLDVAVAYGVPFATNYRVTLVNAGPEKIKVVHLLRELRGYTPQMAFQLVNNLPWVIRETSSQELVDDLRKKFEGVGAKIVVDLVTDLDVTPNL